MPADRRNRRLALRRVAHQGRQQRHRVGLVARECRQHGDRRGVERRSSGRRRASTGVHGRLRARRPSWTKTGLRLASSTLDVQAGPRVACAAGHSAIASIGRSAPRSTSHQGSCSGLVNGTRALERIAAGRQLPGSRPPSIARGAWPPVAPPATMLDCVAVPLRRDVLAAAEHLDLGHAQRLWPGPDARAARSGRSPALRPGAERAPRADAVRSARQQQRLRRLSSAGPVREPRRAAQQVDAQPRPTLTASCQAGVGDRRRVAAARGTRPARIAVVARRRGRGARRRRARAASCAGGQRRRAACIRSADAAPRCRASPSMRSTAAMISCSSVRAVLRRERVERLAPRSAGSTPGRDSSA